MEQTTAAGSKGGAGGAVGDMQRVWEKAPGFRGWGRRGESSGWAAAEETFSTTREVQTSPSTAGHSSDASPSPRGSRCRPSLAVKAFAFSLNIFSNPEPSLFSKVRVLDQIQSFCLLRDGPILARCFRWGSWGAYIGSPKCPAGEYE